MQTEIRRIVGTNGRLGLWESLNKTTNNVKAISWPVSGMSQFNTVTDFTLEQWEQGVLHSASVQEQ